MRRTLFARAAVLSLLGLAVCGQAAAGESYEPQLAALRKSMERYKDYKAAVRDLYLSTVACVHYNGDNRDGHVKYEKGAMGVHFVNLTIRGEPDPMKPNVLIYEPAGGKLELVAVEWLVPLTPETKKRPELFGQPFIGPMEGHEPLIPQKFVHYDLHMWLYKDNPLGVFSPTNPDVKCDGYEHALMEESTKLMPGP